MKTNSNSIYFITFNRAYNIKFGATELLNGKDEDGNLVKVMKIIMTVRTIKMKKKNTFKDDQNGCEDSRDGSRLLRVINVKAISVDL